MVMNLSNDVFGRVTDSRHNSDYPLELVKLSAIASDQSVLSYSVRKASLNDVNEQLSETLASHGFMRADDGPSESNSISVSCVICGAYAIVSRTEIPQSLKHSPNCQFQRTLQVFSGETPRTRSNSTEKLRNHLQTETKTTKTQVACEMGYGEDAVCTAMGLQFVQRRTGFKNAGELIEFLMDREFSSVEQPLNVIPGLAALVNSPSTSPSHSRSRPTQNASSQTSTKESSKTNGGENGKQDHQSLLEETMTLYWRSLCKSCCKNKASYLILPCDHLSLCDDCIEKQVWCPQCGTEAERHVKVYF